MSSGLQQSQQHQVIQYGQSHVGRAGLSHHMLRAKGHSWEMVGVGGFLLYFLHFSQKCQRSFEVPARHTAKVTGELNSFQLGLHHHQSQSCISNNLQSW